MLVDRLQRSTRGFEALCDQKDGQAYIADRAKNEYFGYVVKDKNIEPNEDPVIFEGFMNEPYDGSNLALTRGRENIEPVGEQSEDDRLWLTCVNKHFSVQIYRSDRNFGEP